MRWLVVSVAVHALVVWLVVREEEAHIVRTEPRVESAERRDTTELVVVLDDSGASSGGAGGGGSIKASTTHASTTHASSTRASSTNASSTNPTITKVASTNASVQSRAATRPQTRSADPWTGLSIRNEATDDMRGNGSGNGNGNGNGNGIGFGSGGGVQAARDVPPPPAPPPVSKARPARLIWPNRDLDVEDESYLFVAKVMVDEEGSVVGARMLTSRPGSRAEHAANAIWTFRYAPALDDAGKPIRSTLEQPFQVR